MGNERRLLIRVGAALFSFACSVDDRSVGALDRGAAGTTSSSTQTNQPAPPNSGDGGARDPVACAGAGCQEPAAIVAGGCLQGARRCVGGAPELCSAGAWLPGSPCAEPLGVCLASSGSCVSCGPGSRRCSEGRVEACGDDGAWLGLGMPCSECVPGAADCVGNTARVCSALGAWVGQTCAGTLPVCVAATGSCACSEGSCGPRELCAASGRCEPLGPDCPPIAARGAPEQDLAIVRMRFDPDGSADVLMQNVGGGFVSYAAQAFQLCNGMGNCVYLSDTQPVTLVGDDAFSRRIPATVASGGELAVVFSTPDLPLTTEAYVAWGSGAASGSFEPLVNDNLRLWNTGERISIADSDTGFVSIGDTTGAAGYASCHPGIE